MEYRALMNLRRKYLKLDLIKERFGFLHNAKIYTRTQRGYSYHYNNPHYSPHNNYLLGKICCTWSAAEDISWNSKKPYIVCESSIYPNGTPTSFSFTQSYKVYIHVADKFPAADIEWGIVDLQEVNAVQMALRAVHKSFHMAINLDPLSSALGITYLHKLRSQSYDLDSVRFVLNKVDNEHSNTSENREVPADSAGSPLALAEEGVSLSP